MTKATPEMIAAAWQTWHARHGGALGPGPAFVEAINAAIRALPLDGLTGGSAREDALRGDAADMLRHMGWKSGDRLGLHSVIELMTRYADAKTAALNARVHDVEEGAQALIDGLTGGKGESERFPRVSAETEAFMQAEKQRLGVSTNSELLRAKLREAREPEADLAGRLAQAASIAAEHGWDRAAQIFAAPSAPAPVQAGMRAELRELSKGETYLEAGADCHTSGINVGEHGNRIQCYGQTPELAEKLRDELWAALAASAKGKSDV